MDVRGDMYHLSTIVLPATVAVIKVAAGGEADASSVLYSSTVPAWGD